MKPSPVPSVLAGFEATALAAARGVTLADFLRIAVDCVAKMLGAEHCSLLLVDGGVLRRGAEIGLPEDFVVAIDGIERSDGHGTCGTAAFFGRPVITEDIETDPDWDAYRELARAAGLRACWSVPVRRPDGPVLGTFATYSRAPLAPSASQVHLAESYATMVALGLEFLRQQSGVAKSYESVVRALSGALDARDEYTAQHSTETGELARAVGGRLGLERPELERLTLVARLHDIGKLGIPTDILVRPGPLGGDEWGLMRQHPVIGERILRPVPDFADVATAVRHEHERWDGGAIPTASPGSRSPCSRGSCSPATRITR